jgi:hypothetical protein
MKRLVFRILVAVTLVAAGWSVGRAQTSVANFELTVDAPGGQTVITCAKGCDFTHDVGSIAGLPHPNTKFTFGCSGDRCRATINGAGHVMR